MTIALPPHRPTPGELEAARAMELPATDAYVDAMLELVHVARTRSQTAEALNILRALVLARPEDRRIYQAFGVLYTDLGQQADAAACFAQASALDEGSAPNSR
jgi:Flp pilus assembly protein TadD